VGNLLQELRRRNVFRVGAAYLIVGWLIVQIVETVSDPLGLPAWTEAFFIVLLLAGFPVALIFAWAFEITPEGVKKTHEVNPEASVTATTGKKLNYAIIAALVLALAYFIVERQVLHDHSEDAASDTVTAVEKADGTSIAVLPFVNMSADAEQEYFSDGISEELLNLLAKIPELRVAARTSSFQFKGQNLDIGKVAEQLNVDHVLEGSVRKANTRVRITAQLIEADSGFHLWSDTYDRELTDIFGIQDEISAAIVAALSQTLGLVPGDAPQVFAAANPAAYNEFLLGQYLIKKRTKTDIEASLMHFEKALELDPDYAPAHASLALGTYLLTRSSATYGSFTLEETLSVAEPHIERALELDPDFADAHAIKGVLLQAQYRYQEAIPYFEEALRLNPSLTDVRNWYSNTLGSIGRPTEAFEIQKAAYTIDPLSVLTLNNHLNNLRQRRRFEEMEPIIERLEQLDPVRASLFRAWILTMHRQHADATAELFRGVDLDPDQTRIRAAAANTLAAINLNEEARIVWPFPDAELVFSDPDDPARTLELAIEKYEKTPNDTDAIDDLAWAHLIAGNNKEALQWAKQSLEQLDESQRPIDYTNVIFAIDAWQRGDADDVNKYLAPIDQTIATNRDAGVDVVFMHWSTALHDFMRGNEDSAAAAMEMALSREVMFRDWMDHSYRILGMGQNPRFAAIKAEYETYIDSERLKFLQYACGEIGFTSWKPRKETCRPVAKAQSAPQ